MAGFARQPQPISIETSVVSDEKPLQSHGGWLEIHFAWKPLIEPGIRANV
jgi:hypothetical protein